jgi:succinoglycan biosynthesis protein ExoM
MTGSVTVQDIGLVSVAVLTFRRNEEVAELLPRLEEQAELVAPVDVEVVVVDNDPDAGARELVESYPSARVRYVHEPAPGIAHARNRALDETASAHLLVFIDDDERPLGQWLPALVGTYRRTGAAAVAGLVIPDYAFSPDPWIEAGGFFVRKQYPDGTVMPAAGSGNLLLDVRQVRRHGLRFDERFGLTGGSDHLFTRDLVKRGGTIVWSDRAEVVDKVPAQRLTRQWVVQRQYRVGNTWARTGLVLADPGPARVATRLRLTARGLARIGLGGARVALGRVTGSDRAHARGSRMLARGRGMVSGAWGVTFHEYRRTT